MEEFGALALVPAAVVIVLAVWSRRSIEPLLADGVMVWIALAVTLFGALTRLIVHSGGALAFSGKLVNFVKDRKSALLSTWVLGLIIFIDDYLNALTVGSSMKGLTDEHKVSRQMLAYIVDTTAAPICVTGATSRMGSGSSPRTDAQSRRKSRDWRKHRIGPWW